MRSGAERGMIDACDRSHRRRHRPRPAARAGGCRRERPAAAGVQARARIHARAVRGHRHRPAVPELRGRALDLRPGLAGGSAHRPCAGARLRREARRARGHRHAQLPGMGAGLHRHHRHRRRGRGHERPLAGRRDGLRADRLRRARGVCRHRAAAAPGRMPARGRPCRTAGAGGARRRAAGRDGRQRRLGRGSRCPAAAGTDRCRRRRADAAARASPPTTC